MIMVMSTRTLTISLRPNPKQAQALQETMEAFNAACDFVSQVAWDERAFNNFRLRRLTYRAVRDRFGLPAQLAQHAIAKVAAAYKVSRQVPATFHPLGAVTYDVRVMRLLGVSAVSMTLISGREKVLLSTGGYHARRLSGALLGEADLVYQPERKRFRLHLSLKLPDAPISDPADFLGVDFGIKNIAADSDGTLYAGGRLRRLRKRARRVRQRLQKLGTRGSRRLLVKRRKKEQRRATHINHVISKKIVAAAKGTGRGVAVEDLTGIRDRTTVRHERRAEHSGWAFHQLRFFLEYKCADAGIPCVAVDARNTSRTCPRCGTVDKRNRPSQAVFCCIHCALVGHADLFAACEIAQRATLVSWPNCPERNAPGKGSAVLQGKVPLSGVAQCPHPLGVG
jgi:IS605 OrfB family transposase